MKQMYDTEVKRQTFGSPLIIASSKRQAAQDGIKSLLVIWGGRLINSGFVEICR